MTNHDSETTQACRPATIGRGLPWLRTSAQPCCGATNPACAVPPGVARWRMTPTGCETCGHPLSCHVWRP